MKFPLWTAALLILFTLLFEFHSQTVSTLYHWFTADLTAKGTGTIQSAELEYHRGRGRSPECEILYTFTSRTGTYHQSTLVSYLGEQHDPFGTCDKFTAGDEVPVFYDPGNPDLAVLELTELGWDLYLDVFMVLLLTLGISIFVNYAPYSWFDDSGSGDCAGGDGGD